MKNMIEICKDFGIEIPADKHAEFNKAVAENYKTAAEFEKKVNRLTDDLNAEKEAHKTTKEALTGFEGLGNAEDVKRQLEDANKKIKEAQDAAQKQLEERDFNIALKAELDSIKFTSAAAKKSVEAEIRGSGLKLKDGKILGLNDLLDQLKKVDASAFVDEKQEQLEQNKARFTVPNGGGGKPNPSGITKETFAKMSYKERLKIFNENPTLYKELTK